jgi:hypothetical protein
MRQIRKSLFETNSSSTHAICIHKNSKPENFQDKYYLYSFESFCYGRCESELIESTIGKIAYAYIVAKDLSNWESNKTGYTINDFLKNLYEVAEEFYVEPKDKYEKHDILSKENLDELIKQIDKLEENYDAYVDHTEDFLDNGFYEKLMSDKDFVKRLIFDTESYITVGGDEYRGYNLKKIGFQDDYNETYNRNYHYQEDENGWPLYVDPSEKYIGEFWDKVKELRKEFEIYFKGN